MTTPTPYAIDLPLSADPEFSEPVLLRFGGGVRAVRTARQAYEALHHEWPATRAKWYHAATRACSSAMEGRTGIHVARRIFVEAARESRLQA